MLALAGGGARARSSPRPALGAVARIAPAELPRLDEIGIDPAVLLFTLAISLVAGLLFGLIPVLKFGARSWPRR